MIGARRQRGRHARPPAWTVVPRDGATDSCRDRPTTASAGPLSLIAYQRNVRPATAGGRGRSAWRTRRPPPAGATTPAIASRSLLFEQIPFRFRAGRFGSPGDQLAGTRRSSARPATPVFPGAAG